MKDIYFWGWDPPEIPGGSWRKIGMAGCASQTCTHSSHSPEAPDWYWEPRDSNIQRLASLSWPTERGETAEDLLLISYRDGVVLISHFRPTYYHHRIEILARWHGQDIVITEGK